jgi:hypothetical protein
MVFTFCVFKRDFNRDRIESTRKVVVLSDTYENATSEIEKVFPHPYDYKIMTENKAYVLDAGEDKQVDC